MKGWKTLAFGWATALLPVALSYVDGIDWAATTVPGWAVSLIGLATIALRAITNTPIGRSR